MSNETNNAVVEEVNKNNIEVEIKRPIKIDGEVIKSIKLDFSNMTGEDVLKIDTELRREGKSFDNIFSQPVLLMLTSRASNMKVEDLKRLHAADYLEVAFQTRNFFLKW